MTQPRGGGPGWMVVRADGGAAVGLGHVVRTTALAQAWHAQGGAVAFASHDPGGVASRRAREHGFRFVPLPECHPHPADLRGTLAALAEARAPGGPPPWLVLDGYGFGPDYHAAVRAAGFPLLVIDDTAHLPRYHADVLLNQNAGAEALAYPCGPETALLLGPRHALLRPGFAAAPPAAVPPVARRVLVTLGGADAHNLTRRAMRALRNSALAPVEAVVVVGSANPHAGELRAEAETVGGGVSFRLAHDVADMAGLMAWAELAVSAAGSTCWELAALGVPAVLVVSAGNQEGIAAALHARGAAVSLGWHGGVDEAVLREAVERVGRDAALRAALAERSRAMVDGRGAARVAAAMRARTGG